MPDALPVWGRTLIAQPHPPPAAGLSGLKCRTAAEVALEPEPPAVNRVGRVFRLALFVVAIASSFNGFLVGMAISGLGFGMYVAVDLALVVYVLSDKDNAAKDLGVFVDEHQVQHVLDPVPRETDLACRLPETAAPAWILHVVKHDGDIVIDAAESARGVDVRGDLIALAI